jgi:thiol:disulfide interchange protein
MTVQELQPQSRTSIASEVVLAIFLLWSAVVLPLVAPLWTLPGAVVYFFIFRKSRTRQNRVLLTIFVVAFLVSATIDLTLISFSQGHPTVTSGPATGIRASVVPSMSPVPAATLPSG